MKMEIYIYKNMDFFKFNFKLLAVFGNLFHVYRKPWIGYVYT